MARQHVTRWLTFSLLTLATLWGAALSAHGQDVARWSYHVPGDSKPVTLVADEVASWKEGNQVVVLLKGLVLVEHGTIHIRMRQAVVWVDPERRKRTGIYPIEIYAEGDVRLEQGLEVRTSERALLDMSTRGEFKVKSHLGPIVKQAMSSTDPVYQRARAVKGLPAAAATPSAPSVIQRTSAQIPVETPAIPVQTAPAPTPGAAVPPPGTSPVAPLPTTPVNPVVPPNPAPVVPPRTTAPGPSPYNPTPVNPAPATTPQAPPGPQAGPAPVPSAGGGPGPPGPLGRRADGRKINIVPSTSTKWDLRTVPLPNNEQATIIVGGAILTVRGADDSLLLDIMADRIVWFRKAGGDDLESLTRPGGQSLRDTEFYLGGNVEIREQSGPESRVLRADEVYYDVGHDVAIALRADLESRLPGQPEPIHFTAEEMLQLSPTLFKAAKAEVFSSKLPSDPGLKVYVADATLEEIKVPRTTLFGQPIVDPKTGLTDVERQSQFTGRNVFVELEDVPFFYLPYVKGDANDPLGPLQGVGLGYDRIFGFQLRTTWDMYDLLGLREVPGTRWRLYVDYLSDRGPELGTDFDYKRSEMLGIPGSFTGLFRGYTIYDTGEDIIGFRGPGITHPDLRGRVLWRQNGQELPDGFTFQHQISYLSDKNYLEQYFKPEFDNDINQETFLYGKQQFRNMAWTGLGEVRIRNWVTETQWLPRVDGYVIGQSFFDLLTYNVHGSAGYAQLRTTELPQFAYLPTDVNIDTGRFDLWQELSLPFSLGPVRLAPYGILDLTAYTRDISGESEGRLYGGGGLRGSMPLTRPYSGVQSELFNLNGINHKVVLSGNYFIVNTNDPFTDFPQLDRIDDDATDQARRDFIPMEQFLNPRLGTLFATSPLYNPQIYAIRRLVDNRADTLDTIEVLQADLRQRWQTKRGYPGMQHIIDWMTLDLSASYFPDPERDNFDEPFAFAQYDWVWNIGDRTSLVSNGWFDPIENGARVFSIGGLFNRPDRTTFYLGYRELYPVQSQLLLTAISYIFSPKYAMTASSAYDFGTQQAQSNSIVLTRMGKDLQVSLGVTYDAILNNFGVNFEIFPNVAGASRRSAFTNPLGGAVSAASVSAR